jgi:hypothetical protein
VDVLDIEVVAGHSENVIVTDFGDAEAVGCLDLTEPATLTGAHIHEGGFGEPGPIYLDTIDEGEQFEIGETTVEVVKLDAEDTAGAPIQYAMVRVTPDGAAEQLSRPTTPDGGVTRRCGGL